MDDEYTLGIIHPSHKIMSERSMADVLNEELEFKLILDKEDSCAHAFEEAYICKYNVEVNKFTEYNVVSIPDIHNVFWSSDVNHLLDIAYMNSGGSNILHNWNHESTPSLRKMNRIIKKIARSKAYDEISRFDTFNYSFFKDIFECIDWLYDLIDIQTYRQKCDYNDVVSNMMMPEGVYVVVMDVDMEHLQWRKTHHSIDASCIIGNTLLYKSLFDSYDYGGDSVIYCDDEYILNKVKEKLEWMDQF